MDPENLQPASYRGAFFYAPSTTTTGGKKTAKNEILNSDRQVIEEMGKRQRSFSIIGVIAARTAPSGTVIASYESVRDALLRALEQEGLGVLVHPFRGRIENATCTTFTLDESISKLGEASITMAFEVSDLEGTPRAEAVVAQTVEAQVGASWQAFSAQMESDFSITPAYADNATDAIGKLRDFVEAARAAVAPLSKVADEIDRFSSQLSDLATDAASLVNAPTDLVGSVQGVFSTIGALVATPAAIFEAMRSLFDFGSLDVSFLPVDTTRRIERERNRAMLNSMVQDGALVQAYSIALQLDLPTVESIDEVLEVLEAQYQVAAERGSIGPESATALADLRTKLVGYFNAQRDTKPRLIEVEVNAVPARVLAYRLYGSTEEGYPLARLNGVSDASFIEGTVKVLSS